jgi:TRAP-type mannitol/chloroaromatic compound transport system permease small subunit
MLRIATKFVRSVDWVNYYLGRLVMYGIFVMVGVLLWSSISKTLFVPSKWTLEIAQFALVAYYILGGPYSMQLKANVRMDLFYGNWSIRSKAWTDAFTVLFLIFYLGVLLYGALDSTAYSLGYFKGDFFQFYWDMLAGVTSDIVHFRFSSIPETVKGMTGHLEKGPTSWHPYLWPIKTITVFGIFMMLLQSLSELIKDIATIQGFDLRADEPTAHLHLEND